MIEKAGEGIRTLDIQLGKLTLYQLSYTRINIDFEDAGCISVLPSRPVRSWRAWLPGGFTPGSTTQPWAGLPGQLLQRLVRVLRI